MLFGSGQAGCRHAGDRAARVRAPAWPFACMAGRLHDWARLHLHFVLSELFESSTIFLRIAIVISRDIMSLNGTY